MQATSFLLFSFAVLSSVSGDMYLRRTEESDEVTCERFDICNLVHNPRWGINSVEKLCKCPEDTYCPARFVPNDGFSLPVNYRTQMKFCTPLSDLEAELEMCEEDEVAIRVRTVYQIDQVKNVSARIMCNCNHDGPTYWRYHSRFGRSVLDDDELFEVIDNFQCSGKKYFVKIHSMLSKILQNFKSAMQMSFVGLLDLIMVLYFNDALVTPYMIAAFYSRNQTSRKKSNQSSSIMA